MTGQNGSELSGRNEPVSVRSWSKLAQGATLRAAHRAHARKRIQLHLRVNSGMGWPSPSPTERDVDSAWGLLHVLSGFMNGSSETHPEPMAVRCGLTAGTTQGETHEAFHFHRGCRRHFGDRYRSCWRRTETRRRLCATGSVVQGASGQEVFRCSLPRPPRLRQQVHGSHHHGEGHRAEEEGDRSQETEDGAFNHRPIGPVTNKSPAERGFCLTERARHRLFDHGLGAGDGSPAPALSRRLQPEDWAASERPLLRRDACRACTSHGADRDRGGS